MGIVIMKFGGAALAGIDSIRRAADLVRAAVEEGQDARHPAGSEKPALNSVLAVVSAMDGVSESLKMAARAAEGADLSVARRVCADLRQRHVEAARSLAPDASAGAEAEIESIIAALDARLQGVRLVAELSDRSMDEIAAAGERLGSILLALALGAPSLDARTILRTDSRFGRARPDAIATTRLATERLLPLLGPGRIAVTQGAIGSDSLGSATTLGPSGADFSASLFGAALRASEVRVWTDAEGILTGDPQIIPDAGTVEVLGYEEASELVAFGAKILHPATIRPALEAGIPVTVRCFSAPAGRFTTIRPGGQSGKAVVALAMRRQVAIVSVRQEAMMDQAGFLARFFAAFGRLGVSVDLVSTSEICVSVSLDMSAPLERVEDELAELGTVDIATDRAVIAVVGDILKEAPVLLRKTFEALGDLDIDMLSMGANDINLSIALREEVAELALKRLHEAFFGHPADGPRKGGGA